MKFNALRTMALTSAVALGFAFVQPVFAQVETVDAKLTTTSAISSADVSDMDFGTWLAVFVAGDAPTITLTDDGSVAATQTGTVANGSQIVQITAPATEGVLTVQIPAPGTLTMTRSNSSDFADANLTLSTTTYRTASQAGTIDGDTDTGTITVLAGATDETVTFGGDIDIGGAGASPADASHTASFDITFSY